MNEPSSLYEIPVKTIDGTTTTLEQYRGKVLLIVNVASKCGFTSQYAGLEGIFHGFRDRGFFVLGFPCNQFGSQEPGSEEEIRQFCSLTYGVTFPMFGKIDVNGDDTHPLYRYLKSHAPGLLGSEAIKWNFTKFLVDRQGTTIKRFGSMSTPESLVGEIEALL